MVKLFKVHKYSGLLAGALLFLLAFTGFFLDHKNWSFMYTLSFENVPESVYAHEKRLVEAYWVDPKDETRIIVGSRRGIYHKQNNNFVKTLDLQCLSLRFNGQHLFAATDDGIYILKDKVWSPFALQGEYINALSTYKGKILASLDKKELILLDASDATIFKREPVLISEDELKQDIKLSRFVRDLHYGRGLFDGLSSLLINDYAAFVLMFLSLSGYLIYYLIKTKKQAALSRKLIRLHANIFVIVATIPFVILLITGVFLDHPKLLGKFMSSATITQAILPPVYSSLEEDIWSVDLGDDIYRVGNRYGVYESSNMQSWKQVSRGFAYKMKHLEGSIYVSGMGAPNRIFKDKSWRTLPKTPHMFRDLNIIKDKKEFLSHNSKMELPKFEGASLYSILLALHDGSFFASWWVWVNDIGAILLLILAITGTLRYLRKKRLI
ncbi:PepSY domain-containing protein [Sulfurimonas sp. MAG313]|nr:PepSY-associated TM helix domain-containing protein [Sulfurimonas sp. MAG313]MDF1879754.1 PepSY domain-containing protein [Sulfurimonas sp. MAG313]